MDNFSIQSSVSGSVTVIAASGRIDSETAPALDAELVKIGAGNNKIVLDLKGVEYLSSAGLRAIVKASQAAEKSGGAVRLASVPESIQSVLFTVGLNQKIGTYATANEAIASF